MFRRTIGAVIPALTEIEIDLSAGASRDVTFTISPTYFEGGLTMIEIKATVGDEAETALLRVQLQPGQAPDEDDSNANDDESDDENDGDDNTASVQQSTDSKNEGVPTWVWFAGGGALVLAGVAVGVVFFLRRT